MHIVLRVASRSWGYRAPIPSRLRTRAAPARLLGGLPSSSTRGTWSSWGARCGREHAYGLRHAVPAVPWLHLNLSSSLLASCVRHARLVAAAAVRDAAGPALPGEAAGSSASPA